MKMVKSTIAITMDSNLIELARNRNINISGICNEFIKGYLEIDEIEISEIDEMENDLKTKEAEISALKIHLKVVKDKAERKAKQEKAEADKATKYTFSGEQLKMM
jgi:hypothetical protein